MLANAVEVIGSARAYFAVGFRERKESGILQRSFEFVSEYLQILSLNDV